MGYHLPIRERLLFVSAGMILVAILMRKSKFPDHKLNSTHMNNEEQKKKELEKRGEDNPGSGELPGSSMSKDQRKDAEKVKEGEAGVQDSAKTGDQNANRNTGITPDSQAGVTDIDRGIDRAKE
jgi:hypothetical protein